MSPSMSGNDSSDAGATHTDHLPEVGEVVRVSTEHGAVDLRITAAAEFAGGLVSYEGVIVVCAPESPYEYIVYPASAPGTLDSPSR